MSDPDSSAGPAYLRVVRGEPTPEELAALVTVLASLGGSAVEPSPQPREWNAPWRMHQTVHAPGAGGWRSSALPR